MAQRAHLIAHVAHQRDTALDARERLLASATSSPGGVVLATCHRVELYDVAPRVRARPEMRSLVDEDAVLHLFRVAAGLDSAIAGESQIRHQIRTSYEAVADRVHPVLRRLLERALHVGREVRRTTALGSVRRSVGSLAVDETLRAVDEPSSATVLVVGAGEMGKLAVRALARRVARVLVANRDRGKAEALAAANGAAALSLADVRGALAVVDAVISAADTRGTLLTRELLGPRASERTLVVVDIAVPRSVAADARDVPGLMYRSVDDLVDPEHVVPGDEIARAADLCRREAAAFMREWRERDAAHAIREVRASAERIRLAQLDRALRRLGHLGERDRRVVAALSVGLTNSLLHGPTIALREEPSRSEGARVLFGLRRTDE